jgi:hypothetical protein
MSPTLEEVSAETVARARKVLQQLTGVVSNTDSVALLATLSRGRGDRRRFFRALAGKARISDVARCDEPFRRHQYCGRRCRVDRKRRAVARTLLHR